MRQICYYFTVTHRQMTSVLIKHLPEVTESAQVLPNEWEFRPISEILLCVAFFKLALEKVDQAFAGLHPHPSRALSGTVRLL
jgi:hypothetical protein